MNRFGIDHNSPEGKPRSEFPRGLNFDRYIKGDHFVGFEFDLARFNPDNREIGGMANLIGLENQFLFPLLDF